MKRLIERIRIPILGLLAGAVGSFWVLLGAAFAFVETEPGMRDYEEDIALVPFGYFMMITWLIAMIVLIILFRKKKEELTSFTIAYIVGLVIMLVVIFWP